MATALVYHDLPVAAAIRDRTTDLTVVEADTDAAVCEELERSDIFVTNPTRWSDVFLDHLDGALQAYNRNGSRTLRCCSEKSTVDIRTNRPTGKTIT